jgi:hypothetical protein
MSPSFSYTFVWQDPPARGDMRLLPPLSVLSLLLGTRAYSHRSREPALHRLDVRDPIVDVCVTLDTTLSIPGAGVLGSIGEFMFLSSLTCQKVVPVSLKQKIHRGMHLSVGPSCVHRDEHRHRPGR